MGQEHQTDGVLPPISFGLALLAAGSSQRMGTSKLLLPWAGTSVVGHIIQHWQTLGARQIAVIMPPDSTDLGNELIRLGFSQQNRIPNPEPKRGMFSSIQCAARWSAWDPSLTHWIITLGDQPHLQLAVCRQLLQCACQHPNRVCQPQYRGRWRHPVVLPKAIFVRLNSSRAQTFRDFLLGCERTGFDSQDAGLEQDIDTPEDYRKALALLGAS